MSLFSAKIAKAKLRTNMIISEFFPKWRDYGFKYAVYSSAYWLGWYIPLFRGLLWWGYRGKTNFLNQYFLTHFSELITRYQNRQESNERCKDYCIWIFWWQGYEQMPELVKACYNQLRNLEKNNVILLSESNYSDYVNIPQYIVKKLENGTITYTHFSDILRVSLLSQYGGMWVDATCWVPSGIPKGIKCLRYVTPNTKGLSELAMWSNSMWCGWNIGTNIENAMLFSFARDILFEYHKQDLFLVDYVLLDFVLWFAYHHFPVLMEEIDSIPVIAKERNALWFLMNSPFDSEKYDDLKRKCWIFKLSYKSKLLTRTENGDTFYGHLLKESKKVI